MNPVEIVEVNAIEFELALLAEAEPRRITKLEAAAQRW